MGRTGVRRHERAPYRRGWVASRRGRGVRCRIATFTNLTTSDIDQILSQYGLGPARSWRAIAAGTVNTNVAVELEAGKYVFLRINEGKQEADVRAEAGIVAHLATRGVPTPKPLETLLHAPCARHGTAWASLFPWVDGHHLVHTNTGAAETRQVGDALAKLHLAGADYPHRPEGFYTLEHLEQRLQSFVQTEDPALRPHIPRLETLLAAAKAHRQASRASVGPTGIREGIIHQDLFMDNVLFTAGPDGPGKDGAKHLSALIDFEQAVWGRWVYDLAVCLLAWCFVGQAFEPELVEAMLSGYESRVVLTAAERAALVEEARLAALRFTITRITDVYLRKSGAKKDFRSYLARLDALERNPSVLALAATT